MLLTLRHAGTDYIDFTPADLTARGVPAPVIDAALTDAVASEGGRRIDAFCDAVLGNSVSRGERYAAKEAAAVAFRDAGYPDAVPPDVRLVLGAEAEARAMTVRALADLVLATADRFRALAGRAEAGRARCKQAAASVPGLEAKRVAVAQVVADVMAGD